MRNHPLSAAQTALLSGAGGLIMSLSFLLPALFDTRFDQSGFAVRALLILPPFVIGALLLILSTQRLKRGIQQAVWPSADVEALRTTIQSRSCRAFLFTCLAVWSVSLFTKGKFHELAWAAYPLFLSGAFIQNQMFKSGVPSTAPLTISPSDPAPLTSAHWPHP